MTRSVRPVPSIFADPENAWYELIPDGSYRWDAPIKDYSDLVRLRFRRINVDWEGVLTSRHICAPRSIVSG